MAKSWILRNNNPETKIWHYLSIFFVLLLFSLFELLPSSFTIVLFIQLLESEWDIDEYFKNLLGEKCPEAVRKKIPDEVASAPFETKISFLCSKDKGT